jgi:hypothetical protein
VRRVEGLQFFEVIEGFTKECVRESSLRLRVGERSGGIGSSQLSQKRTEGWCLEALKRRRNDVVVGRRNFVEEHRVHFAKIVKGDLDGWSSMENSRGLGSIKSHRGTRRLWCMFSKCKYQENRVVGFGPTGSLDHSHILHLEASEGEGSKPL